MLTLSASPNVNRHSVHWDLYGTHVFRVQNTLYKLDARTISRVSRMFEHMFSMPQPSVSTADADGTEERPIYVPNAAETEFDLFVSQSYGMFCPPPPNDVLVRLLRLGQFLDADSTQLYAVHHILARERTFHPALLIHAGLEFNNREFFVSGFRRLVQLRLRDLTPEHKTMLGPRVFQAMAEVKELLDEHKRIVAAEPPPVTHHADDCPSHRRCKDDWFAVWWNGMARYLLDGRNPLGYDDAVKRFEHLQFGEMGEGCKEHMLDIVKGGAAFRHATLCVEDVCARLADAMIKP